MLLRFNAHVFLTVRNLYSNTSLRVVHDVCMSCNFEGESPSVGAVSMMRHIEVTLLLANSWRAIHTSGLMAVKAELVCYSTAPAW